MEEWAGGVERRKFRALDDGIFISSDEKKNYRCEGKCDKMMKMFSAMGEKRVEWVDDIITLYIFAELSQNHYIFIKKKPIAFYTSLPLI